MDLNKKQLISDLNIVIQGEGRYAGVPHLLIRLVGCNLNCKWCDSSYASWKLEKPKYSLQDLINIVIKNPHIENAFITGGEPTIPMNDELLKGIIDILNDHDIMIALETNGTIFKELDIDFVTISPKLKNSIPIVGEKLFQYNIEVTEHHKKNQENNRINISSIQKWYDNYDTQFKFVISDKIQIKEVKDMQFELNLSSNDIYLMPEGITNEQLQKKRKFVYELCLKYGYNYSDRLHVLVYDNKRDK